MIPFHGAYTHFFLGDLDMELNKINIAVTVGVLDRRP
jgi:hypothetical protein